MREIWRLGLFQNWAENVSSVNGFEPAIKICHWTVHRSLWFCRPQISLALAFLNFSIAIYALHAWLHGLNSCCGLCQMAFADGYSASMATSDGWIVLGFNRNGTFWQHMRMGKSFGEKFPRLPVADFNSIFRQFEWVFRLKKWFLLLSFLSYARFPRRRITNCFPWKAVKWWADAINLFSGLSLVFFFVTFVVFQVLAFWASVSLIICEQEPWNDTAKPHSVKVALQNWLQNRPAFFLFVLNWREWQFFAHVLASASSSIMCAKKNILRIIRAFINLMSAHSYKLTIYCIQSTHSARVWGRTEQHVRVCHHPKLKTFVSAWHKRDPKVKQLRFAWMLELCFRQVRKKKVVSSCSLK